MWRAVGAMLVVGLAMGLGISGGAPVSAQEGYAGEAGPAVPLPPIGYGKQKKKDAPASRRVNSEPRAPARKPRKPVTRARADTQQKKRQNPSPAARSQSERDKHLCKALQACRNEFMRCKSKIKHPDQSEAWSLAKEGCGEHYKTCVQKDFRGGEWFFTRWFYFQELDCG